MQIFSYYLGTLAYVKYLNTFSGIYFGKINTFVFLYLERKMNIKCKIVNRKQKFYIKSSEKPNVFIYNTGKSKMLYSLAQCHQ